MLRGLLIISTFEKKMFPWHQYLMGLLFLLAGFNHLRTPNIYEVFLFSNNFDLFFNQLIGISSNILVFIV